MILNSNLILKNYINRETLRTSGAILMVLLLIFISTRFIKYIQLAVDGALSSSAVFHLLALQIPAVAGFLLPLSFFIAVLLVFGRLYAENEMAVIHGVGLSEVALAKYLLPLAIMLSVVAGSLSFWVTPWSIQQSNSLLAKEKAAAEFGAFSPGRFRENSAKSGVVFVATKQEDGQIGGLFAVSGINQENGTFEIQVARSGKIWSNVDSNSATSNGGAGAGQEENSYLVLEKGNTYVYDQHAKTWRTSQYEGYFMLLEDPEDETLDLKNKSIDTIKLLDIGGPEPWAELHWRLSAPISLPILCFLAIPLARTQPRKGKFSRLFPAIMVYVVYALLMMNSRRLIETQEIPYQLGFWWIHALMISLCIWLYRPRSRRNLNSRLNKGSPANV